VIQYSKLGFSPLLLNPLLQFVVSQKTDEMVKESPGREIYPTYSLEEFVESLEKPRKILLMVKAGPATDATIDGLLPLLDDDDMGP
jgi:6-phosphogluconate dehydrogenase